MRRLGKFVVITLLLGLCAFLIGVIKAEFDDENLRRPLSLKIEIPKQPCPKTYIIVPVPVPVRPPSVDEDVIEPSSKPEGCSAEDYGWKRCAKRLTLGV